MLALQTRPWATAPASPHATSDQEPGEWAFAIHPVGQPTAIRRFALRLENHPATTCPAGSAVYGRFGKLPKHWIWIYFRYFALTKSSCPNLIWHHVTTAAILHAKRANIAGSDFG